VLIQPELPFGEAACANPEQRLTNVELLSIEEQADHPRNWLGTGLRQAGLIAGHMAARRHRQPLFWFYNTHMVFPYALLPARARVFHATENYFDFSGLTDNWLNHYRYAIEVADLAICCSSGVAHALTRQTRQKNLLTLPNGCDFLKYSQPVAPREDWPAQISDRQQSARRMAVFAGNINHRLDFELVEALVTNFPEIGFVFAGPSYLCNLSDGQRSAWERLQKMHNFRTLGRIPPEDIPALYWRCDVGIIPYRFDLPLVVENGFPLKALEMAAAGLPVVASLMKPLREIAAAVTVVADAEAFCASLATHSRRTRVETERSTVERLCRTYDYNVLFERMTQELAPRVGDGPCRPADLASLVERIGLESYGDELVQIIHAPSFGPAKPTCDAPASLPSTDSIALIRSRVRFLVGMFLTAVPPSVRRRVPAPIRKFARRWLP
jgi:glycosyltransferase involved in cell wall biosynthesis